MVTVRPMAAADAPAWDAFVAAHPSGTFCHRATWAPVIERAFGHTPLYAVAEQDGAMVGVLPLVHVKTRLFGNSLMSTPFCVYGGPLVTDPAVLPALDTHVAQLMARTGARVTEFRLRDTVEGLPDDAWPTRADLYVTFRKPIGPDDDANLKAIPRKQRAMVRKGIDRGLVPHVGPATDGLHAIYAESVRNLGTPVFSRRYFRILAEAFGPDQDVVTITDDGRPVAAVLSFYDRARGEVLPYYGGGTAAAREAHAADYMYWAVMRHAAAQGITLFDFGRSKAGTGAFAFKKNWGFVPEPLHYRYRLAAGARIPDHNPLNPKYRLMIAAWKRLPLPVANLIGPPIVRGIG